MRAAPDPARHERVLPRLVRSQPGMAVLTGGQTGVDTLAARAALRAGLPVHLIFPKGYRQEDGSLTPSRRRALSGATAHALSSDSFRYRTWTSVYLCDAVILLDPAGGDGCRQTARAAQCLGRPLLTPGAGVTSAEITNWLDETGTRVLMLAGCRASRLASQHAGRGLPGQLAKLAEAARERHIRLLATARGPQSGPGEPSRRLATDAAEPSRRLALDAPRGIDSGRRAGVASHYRAGEDSQRGPQRAR